MFWALLVPFVRAGASLSCDTQACRSWADFCPDWDDQEAQCYDDCVPYCLRMEYCHNVTDQDRAAYASDLDEACPPASTAVPKASTVTCVDVAIPSLVAYLRRNRFARVCRPDGASALPLHVWGHGDEGGGPLLGSYEGVLREIASYGFVVAAYASCDWDGECENGGTSFREMLKVALHLEANNTFRVDFGAPLSATAWNETEVIFGPNCAWNSPNIDRSRRPW